MEKILFGVMSVEPNLQEIMISDSAVVFANIHIKNIAEVIERIVYPLVQQIINSLARNGGI